MIRCAFPRTPLRPWIRTARASCLPIWRQCTPLHPCRCLSIHQDQSSHPVAISTAATQAAPSARQNDNLHLPESGDPAAWLALLDRALPDHLREAPERQILSAKEIAKLLLAAQRLVSPKNGIDLLHVLGKAGRWDAVVWLVKCLVEDFAPPFLATSNLALLPSVIQDSRPLSEVSTAPITIRTRNGPAPLAALNAQSLDTLTGAPSLGHVDVDSRLPRDALGQIWSSLGQMTLSCVDGEIQPAVLEIIACLHHHGIMPESIYNFEPSLDATQMQQPPMLRLFSSRIMTSLSDAVWRAQSRAIEEKQASQTGFFRSFRRDVPNAYTVNVAGLRPEVWLELILWASLHGGWILEGAHIIRTLSQQHPTRAWRAVSWRSSVSDDALAVQDWDQFEYLLKTRQTEVEESASDMSAVHRTISTEIVNAYVDALLSVMQLGSEDPGIPLHQVLTLLVKLQDLLRSSGNTLSAGSWDAIALRLFDLRGDVVSDPRLLHKLVKLTPLMGEELNARTLRDLPPYIFDGNALSNSLLHAALRARVAADDIEGAVRVFRSLQRRADQNKRLSVMDFLRQLQSSTETKASDSGLFTGNFVGIDHPALTAQIPGTVLGPFFELLLDVKAYDFAQRLLVSNDIDGPLIAPSSYADPALMPALVRYATETRDPPLLAEIMRATIPSATAAQQELSSETLQNLFDGQVIVRHWDVAERLLKFMREHSNTSWNIANMARVAQAMLREAPRARAGDQHSQNHMDRASEIFGQMINGDFTRSEGTGILQEKVAVLLTVLATVDMSWARFCLALQPLESHYVFDMISGKTFDILLRGIVDGYGSASGRRVLAQFAAPVKSTLKVRGMTRSRDHDQKSVVKWRSTKASARAAHARRIIDLPVEPRKEVIVYGGHKPNIMTFRIILERAVAEFTDSMRAMAVQRLNPALPDLPRHVEPDDDGSDLSAAGSIEWAVEGLRSLGMAERVIRNMSVRKLTREGREALTLQRPALFAGPIAETDSGSGPDDADDGSALDEMQDEEGVDTTDDPGQTPSW